MTVEIWFRDSFETERVEGDLVSLMNGLNLAAAQGKQFAAFQDEGGSELMVQTTNIIKAREVTSNAFIGN